MLVGRLEFFTVLALITRKPIMRVAKYRIEMPTIPDVTLSGNTVSPNFKGITDLGLKARKTCRKAHLANTKILTTFNAPPVEPAEAPTIIKMSKIDRDSDGQASKLAVVKPVVV
ncbi:unnamed protein product [marine sediment metagenome]|uniref:Uncharacterized protein n=1 Tax=marine sediment metagenome TaxID=412755 RepID=X1PZG4_9ZZZZ